jgi:putative addiction module component (TIGR02574 family)
MTSGVQALKTQLAGLSAPERAEIARFLIASLDEMADPEAEAAWDAELARRGEEICSGRAVGEPADQVFTRLASN